MKFKIAELFCARDAKGLVLLPAKAKHRSEAKPVAARQGAQKNKFIFYLYFLLLLKHTPENDRYNHRCKCQYDTL